MTVQQASSDDNSNDKTGSHLVQAGHTLMIIRFTRVSISRIVPAHSAGCTILYNRCCAASFVISTQIQTYLEEGSLLQLSPSDCPVGIPEEHFLDC